MKKLINACNNLGWNIEVKETFNNYKMLRILNEEVKEYESSLVKSYKIKAIINEKTILVETEDLNDIDCIINIIKSNYDVLDNKDKDILAKESIADDRNNSSIDIDEIKNDLLDLYKYKNKYPNILNIDGIFENSIKEINILNSNGIELSQNTDFKCIFISVSVSDKNIISESSNYYLFNEYEKIEFIQFFEKILDDAIKRLNETTVKTNKYNVIIRNNAMFDILNSFKDMFMAKTINKGLSILSDKYLDKVFSSKITIKEEPLNDELKGSYKVLFDGEGNRCTNKIIIDKGKFINKLYDNKEALKESRISTGNSDGVNNLYIIPGNKFFDELVSDMKNGIIITDLSGLHSGINSITGDMSLDAKGYLVENGEIRTPLNSILLSANIFEIFNNVVDVGNDLEFKSTHVGAPSVSLENITIVGEK